MFILDTLYAYDVNNKIKEWKISVIENSDHSIIKTIFGYVNSKMTTNLQKINNGKNIGKRNETTHYEQAKSEAQSKWDKKINQGYFIQKLDNDSAVVCQSNIITFPMLAQDFNKSKNKLTYPCYIQPKLDGFRNIYNTSTNQNTTRQGKEFSIIVQSGKLYEELLSLPKGLILDGELYTNKINFEELGVLRKTKKLTNDDLNNLQKIEYHIYDIVDTNLTFEQRNNIIKELRLEKYEKLIYVPTILISSEEEIQKYHTEFLDKGFEGSMIRNKNSLYKKKQRSYDLLKYKDFQDGEFEIINFTCEIDTSGDNQNLIIWIINIPTQNNEITCKVRPTGTHEERKELYKRCKNNFNEFKGRKLWVKYFEKTQDGNLRFPTTKSDSYKSYIRDTIE